MNRTMGNITSITRLLRKSGEDKSGQCLLENSSSTPDLGFITGMIGAVFLAFSLLILPVFILIGWKLAQRLIKASSKRLTQSESN